MTASQHRAGFKRWLSSSLLVLLAALVAHWLFAIWPWPEYRGASVLESLLQEDVARLEPMLNDQFMLLIRWIWGQVYQVFFVWTGLDWLVDRAFDPRPINEVGGEAFRTIVLAFWKYLLEPLYWSLQLISLRVTVLFSVLPLFLVAALIGSVNGWVGRYLRRTGGGKESGYIYHRVKQGYWICMAGCWALYLVPPYSMDPRWLLPPFLLATLVLSWALVHWFKKQL